MNIVQCTLLNIPVFCRQMFTTMQNSKEGTALEV